MCSKKMISVKSAVIGYGSVNKSLIAENKMRDPSLIVNRNMLLDCCNTKKPST